MSHADFVHLRVHSAYSLSEGAIRIGDLVALCRRHAMPAVAVADSGNLFGALEFSSAAAAAGIQPIIGCQLDLARSDPAAQNGARPAPDQLVLLVQNETGYRNLLQLVSRAYLAGEPGEAAELELTAFEGRSDGLIALTGGPRGAVGRFLRERRDEWAEGMLLTLARLFPGRLYVEIQRHGLPEEGEIEGRLVDLAYKHELPLVATNEAFFTEAEIYEAHDALLCIAEGAYVAQGERRRLTPEHRFKSAEEMRRLFDDLPEAVDNTLVIARRCAFHPEPVAPILPAFPTGEGRSEAEELRAQARAGLEERLADQACSPGLDEAARAAKEKGYRDRLDYELGMIEQMGFPGYFLIVADFIKWAKKQGIPVGPGRGSGAGSVVAWALTITDLDPLRWGLLFERFLNPERVSMPDFDIDFCQDRRDEVIRYVQDKYGHDRVAQIITFGKLQARAVLRDVGRVLQMPYPQVDRICKLVPNNPASPVTLQQAIDGEPALQEMRAEDQAVARLIDIALKLEGLYRHASTHAAGVVIGDQPLDQLVPLYRDPRSEMPVTQFNMKFVEQAGLVKFDFLGLKTLTVLARARELIRAHQPDFDLEDIPLDDAKTYEMLGRAETVGVFQLESSGMRDVLRRLKADRFEDIIAVVALYRPGPMDNIPSYINRKHGELPDYLYPTLEGILKETFGIMIYQEQVMQIAQELAGYSLGGADLLRRAMGKKIKSEMEAQRKSFVEGAVARSVPEAKAVEIFEQVNKFAGYGFNKSHAAAYAMVAYQTAYLKANHPVEFLAASMTYDMGNTDKLNVFRQELDRLGVPLLPPDVNASQADFGVERRPHGSPAIRYALAAVKNVGAAAMAALVAEREAGGLFKDLGDLAGRLDNRVVNKRQVENLACAGAFDGLCGNRRQVFEGAETLIRHAAAAASERESAQVNLFGGDAAEQHARLALPEVEDWPAVERLRHEFEAIGFYLSAHPLDAYGGTLGRLRVTSYAELSARSGTDSGRKRLAGIVIGKQERTSRQGNRFAFVQLSDTSGMFEIIVFSELLAGARDLLDSGQPLLVTVSLDRRDNGEAPRLTAQEIAPLDQAVAQAGTDLKLFLSDPAPLDSLKAVLRREAVAGGRGRVALVLGLDGGREVEMELPGGYRLSAQVRQAIKAIPGVVVQEI
ncbi:MAG: DNA polymerase III subunit alpha [Rhodospirillales bacterium]|nr:DNA polymerase III subunit alpha [Rhodospirillales bacterium]MDH3910412.1 DNA polymerase III subunit alpha [Rhodospirillales bacterium]